MDTYFARVTWNWDEWRLPSGHRTRGEHGTYVAKRGYGHEEWLNRTEWVVGGWRYGFIQGVGWSTGLRGKKIDIVLYAIKPNKERVFVGKITNAEVLDEGGARTGLTQFKKQGWLKQMSREIDERVGDTVQFNKTVTDPFAVSNIRFRASALQLFTPEVAIPVNHVLRKYARYRLVRLDSQMSRDFSSHLRRSAMKGMKATALRSRRAIKPGTVDPIEARMQNEIRQLLARRYGDDAVKAELDYADLRVTVNGQMTLIEIKSAIHARLAVRHALGQLLEYAFFAKWDARVDLVVIGRGSPTVAVKKYLELLRKRFGLPLRYKQYAPGSLSFRL